MHQVDRLAITIVYVLLFVQIDIMDGFLGVNGVNRLMFYYQEPESEREPGT